MNDETESLVEAWYESDGGGMIVESGPWKPAKGARLVESEPDPETESLLEAFTADPYDAFV